MSTNVAWNGTTYAVPATGEENWGGTTKVDGLLIALATHGFQKSGGLFTLSADADFGASAGLKSIYYKSRGTVASSGILRLAKTEAVAWRNNADSGNNTLATDTSDQLLYNGVVLAGSTGIVPVAAGGTGISSYTAGDLLYATGATTLSKLAIGAANRVLTSNGSAPAWNTIVNANIDAAAAIAYSKLNLTGTIVNADVSGSAAIAYSKLNLSTSIVNADISAAAAIDFSKLATLSSTNILVGSAGNVATSVTVTGDVTISNTGVTAIGTKKVTAGMLNSGAASSGDVFQADGAGGGSYAAAAAAPNQSYEITNLGIACSVAASALTISLKQKDGSTDPGASSAAVKIGFRDVTSANGDFVQRSVTSSLSTVISSGSTAGFTSGTTQYLYVYAIDNGGTVELGWVGGAPVLDEQTVQTSTTEGGAGGADTRYTFYSTTGRTSKAVRLIARLKFSLTTAGTWDEVPDEIALAPFDTKIAFRSEVVVDTGNGHGSTNNKIRRFTNTQVNVGTAITYADSSTDGGSFTINEEGLYSMTYYDRYSGVGGEKGISKNSTELTTAISTITTADKLVFTNASGANECNAATVITRCKPGDVIRAHTDGLADGNTANQSFRIIKIGP